MDSLRCAALSVFFVIGVEDVAEVDVMIASSEVEGNLRLSTEVDSVAEGLVDVRVELEAALPDVEVKRLGERLFTP